MRIAIDGCVLEPPCPTGVERAAAGIVEALGGALGPDDAAVVVSRAPLAQAARWGGRVAAAVVGGPEAPLLWRETHLVAALRDAGADVLWSPVTAIPLRTDVPRVATFHEAPWLVRPGMEGAIRERAHAVRLRIAASAAARIVCPSEASAQQVRALHPETSDRVRVVRHGVDARFLAPPDQTAAAARRAALGVPPRYVLQVGGTRPRKNVPFLLRAFARFRLRGGRAGLVIAGPGPPPTPLPRDAAAVGWVPDEDLLALYAGAAALAVASESEGFGLPVLEAMARGVPVVACATGGIVEAAGGADAGAALLVAPDTEAFAGALLRVTEDPGVAALLAGRGRRRAAECGWDASARGLVAVLREAGGA